MAAESPTRVRTAVGNENLSPGPGEKRHRRPSPSKQTAALSRHRASPLSPSRILWNQSVAAARTDSPAAREGVADCLLRGAGGLVASSALANGEWVVSRVLSGSSHHAFSASALCMGLEVLNIAKGLVASCIPK